MSAFAINRAPVMTLWAAVVAERLGYDRDEAATLGRVLAGMNAATKAQALGLAKAREGAKPESGKRAAAGKPGKTVALFGRLVPVVKTSDGLRATSDGRPTTPESAHKYLDTKFGGHLDATRSAMESLARSMPKATLAEQAMSLYEAFRPEIPRGKRGWGAKGMLDPAKIRALAPARKSAKR